MAEIKIVFWSSTGNTAQMAALIAQGVGEAGKTAKVIPISDITPADLAADDVFALGCSAMGAEELDPGEVAPFVDELLPMVSGKKVLLFGSYGWGDGEWMRTWEEQMAGAGAILVGGEGCIANESPAGEDADNCVAAGKALAEA